MTYLNFLLIFVIPLCVIEFTLFYYISGPLKKYSLKGILLLIVLAVTYTTPWDNYLLANDVWSYGEDRVLFTLGYVPIEEYGFFVLQTFLSGLWTYFMWNISSPDISKRHHPIGVKLLTLIIVAILWISSLVMLFDSNDKNLYLGLILSWSLPIVLLQLLFGIEKIIQNFKTFLIAVAVPTIYLSIVDAYAIKQRIWEISDTYTTGFNIAGLLPIEEFLFFFMTNIMVSQGLLLFLYMRDDIISGKAFKKGVLLR